MNLPIWPDFKKFPMRGLRFRDRERGQVKTTILPINRPKTAHVSRSFNVPSVKISNRNPHFHQTTQNRDPDETRRRNGENEDRRASAIRPTSTERLCLHVRVSTARSRPSQSHSQTTSQNLLLVSHLAGLGGLGQNDADDQTVQTKRLQPEQGHKSEPSGIGRKKNKRKWKWKERALPRRK